MFLIDDARFGTERAPSSNQGAIGSFEGDDIESPTSAWRVDLLIIAAAGALVAIGGLWFFTRRRRRLPAASG